MKHRSKHRRVSKSHSNPYTEHPIPQHLHHETNPAFSQIYRAAASGTIPSLKPDQVMQLQRLHGNQFVIGLLNRQSAGIVQRDALEQNTTEADRKNLQVSTGGLSSFSDKEMKAFFKDTTEPKPPVEKVLFGADIPAGVQKGLKHLAVEMIQNKSNFSFNSVTNVPLDLKPFGGTNGVYQFALIQRTASPKTQLIIDQVSSTPPPKLDKAQNSKQEKRFDTFEFKWGAGFATVQMKETLYKALARMPDAILERIRGVTFMRTSVSSGGQDDAGRYDPNTHTIELYDKAFRTFLNSADASGADWFTYAVTHEISHAVDYESFNSARQKVATLRIQLRDAAAEAKKASTDDYDLNGKPTAQKQAKLDKVKQLQNEVFKAEEELSKLRQNLDVTKGGAHANNPAFKSAQGKPISTYGVGKTLENFAELLSVYILNPKLLKSLRPDAFDYFAKNIK